jgi:hypothetical protein
MYFADAGLSTRSNLTNTVIIVTYVTLWGYKSDLSDLSLFPLYWYVAACEIQGNHIMNHMFSIDKLKSKCRDLYLVVNKIHTRQRTVIKPFYIMNLNDNNKLKSIGGQYNQPQQ